jgi:hypothetical protein
VGGALARRVSAISPSSVFWPVRHISTFAVPLMTAGCEEDDDQGIAELGQKLKDQGPFSLRMDQVGTELGQAESRFRAAQTTGAGIQAFQKYRNGKLPERRLRFDWRCGHHRLLQCSRLLDMDRFRERGRTTSRWPQ